MQILQASTKAYLRAITTLQAGGLVILPTETVYGIAGLASSDQAVERVFAAKGRTFNKPLSLGVWSQDMAKALVKPSALYQGLAEEFWPGPLTIVTSLKAKSGVSTKCNAGGPTIGLRWPDTRWTYAFAGLGFFEPLALTSANISGQPAAITAADAASRLGEHVDLIIDDGPSSIGKASTVISVDGVAATVLRAGGLSPDSLAPYALDFA